VKRRSAHFTSFSLIIFTTSLELIPPPLVDRSSREILIALVLLRRDRHSCTLHANPAMLKSIADSAS
jgi:hypothetical protein